MRIAIVTNHDWFFLSHRLPIALAALQEGHEVYLLAIDTGRRNEIENYGIQFVEILINPTGKNPIQEIQTFLELRNIYKRIKPDVIHHVTMKVSLLGCLAAKSLGIRNCVNAISGFGYAFTDNRKGLFQTAIKLEMYFAFNSNYWHFILQNPDDFNVLKSRNYVPESHVHLIKGSGVDLDQFTYKKPIRKGKLIVLFPARILGDKGVMELVTAMKLVKNRIGNKAKLILAGDCNSSNPTTIHEKELKNFLEEDYIEWVGFQKNMVKMNEDADIVVLPSYREGLPKSLIEACAIGRPIVTTDVVGCRECVIENYNGHLVPAKNVDCLADAIVHLVENPSERLRMGENGRFLAEKEFSVKNVVKKHLEIYENIIKER